MLADWYLIAVNSGVVHLVYFHYVRPFGTQCRFLAVTLKVIQYYDPSDPAPFGAYPPPKRALMARPGFCDISEHCISTAQMLHERPKYLPLFQTLFRKVNTAPCVGLRAGVASEILQRCWGHQ